MNQATNHERLVRLCTTAVLLALCIASQFLKNVSVYLTGPLVNLILIVATLSAGLWSGAIISVIAPLTSFLITGSPVMKAIPLIIPCVMVGNLLLVLGVWLFTRRELLGRWSLAGGAVVGSVVKAGWMTGTISCLLLGLVDSGLPEAAIATAKVTFSVTQLITALIATVLACLIWPLLARARKSRS